MLHSIKLIYTSDTHGRITTHDFMTKKQGPFGLSRLSSYLKQLNEPYLLMDNGDFLQGSPLLDITRKQTSNQPVADVFNALHVQYVTPGNHDFNFGLSPLLSFQNAFQGKVICANIYKDGKPFFTPYVIHEIGGIRIALIGLTTEYIPVWERKENIEGLEFKDAVEVTTLLIREHHLKEVSDLIVVMYHGGYEQNITTHEHYGKITAENKGYQLFDIPEIDILLTGHQHVPQIHSREGRWTLQTSHNAVDAGVITVTINEEDSSRRVESIHAELIKLSHYGVDTQVESILNDSIQLTEKQLIQSVGRIKTEMKITSPLSARIQKHPLFQLINHVQMLHTGATLSCASLPNETHGLPKEVTLLDLYTSFPFENDLVVLEVTGKKILEALEQNASYFSVQEGQVVVNPKFLHPKVEHYNYDVYDGIEYVIDLRSPQGDRIRDVNIQGNPISLKKTYTLALNSYRATGSGGFDMFKDCKVRSLHPVSYVGMIQEYLERHPDLVVEVVDNFKVII